MELQRSLRSEIERNLREKGYTLSKLGEITGINPGNLSEILNGNPPRPITIGQLDTMAAAFGHAPGWLYELYSEECLFDGKISRPRLIPFLVRCAEIGRQECIEAAVSKLLDNPKNVSILFTVAEKLFHSGKRKEAVPFYELVAENEKDSHSDQFVMSQYRLFRAAQGTDAEENWKAVIRFEPFRRRLPENFQLDALLQLANVCFTLHKWKEVEKYADELRELATKVYEEELRKWKGNETVEPLNTERHLVVYYGQGYLLKGVALQLQERYREAIPYVHVYADLGWFELIDEVAKTEIEKFRGWAKANVYTLELLTGNISVLAEYITFLINSPAEIPAGLLTIMEAANKYGFSIEDVLEQLSDHIDRLYDYQDPYNIARHFQFRYQKAMYEFRKGRITEGITETLRCLDLSDRINHQQEFKRCISLFWKYRHSAADDQIRCFETILHGGSAVCELV